MRILHFFIQIYFLKQFLSFFNIEVVLDEYYDHVVLSRFNLPMNYHCEISLSFEHLKYKKLSSIRNLSFASKPNETKFSKLSG